MGFTRGPVSSSGTRCAFGPPSMMRPPPRDGDKKEMARWEEDLRLNKLRYERMVRERESTQQREQEAQQRMSRRQEACTAILTPQWQAEEWLGFEDHERKAILQLKARLLPE